MVHYTTSFNSEGKEVFSPMRLEQLCMKLCVTEVKSLLFVEEESENGRRLTLKPTVPGMILESIIEEYNHSAPEYVPMIMELCENSMLGRISVSRINLTNCQSLTHSQFEAIMKIKPTSLEIHNCSSLIDDAFDIINKYGENLESLNFGNTAGEIIYWDIDYWMDVQNKNSADYDVSLGLLNTPKLRRLTVWNLYCRNEVDDEVDFMEWLTQRFISNLEHLDMSFCNDIRSLDFLLKAKDTLKFLGLHYAFYQSTYPISWDVLTNLRKLTFLDVSHCDIDDKKTGILKKIVESLPNLAHLDLSYNKPLAVSQVKDGSGRYRIDALACREQRPLNFVNLYKTDTSQVLLVPARVVVRDKDKLFNQLVSAIKSYSEAGELPPAMINSLEIISKQNMTDNRFSWKEAVNLVLQVVGTNKDYLHNSSSSVINIFCNALEELDQFTGSQKDEILQYVVKVMNQDWRSCDELENAISVLRHLPQSMNLWDPLNAKILVSALLRVAKTAIEKHKKRYDTPTPVEEWDDDCYEYANLVKHIGEYLSNNLNDSALAQIRTLSLDREIMSVIREVMEWELEFDQEVVAVAIQYWKICDKIIIMKLGY